MPEKLRKRMFAKVGLIVSLVGFNYVYAECSLGFTSPADQTVLNSPNITVYGQGSASADLGNIGTVTATLNGTTFFQQTGQFTATVTFFRTRGVSIVLQEGANTLSVAGSVGGCSASDEMTLYYYPEDELPPVTCACDELKDTANNSCEALSPSTEWRPEQQLVYLYPDNNHDDAPRCEPVAVPESDAQCNNTSTSNPINCATGQKHYTEVDYRGFGLDALEHRRQYYSPLANEADADDEHTEPGLLSATSWRTLQVPSIQRRYFDDGAQLLTFRFGEGLRRVFFRAAGASHWSTNPELNPLSLIDSGGFTIRLANGRTFKFNSAMQASEQATAQGDPRYFYEYSDVLGEPKLSRISNRFGRSLTYHYNDAGLLSYLVDQSGQAVHYRYDSQDNLTEVWQGDEHFINPTLVKQYLYERPELPHHITGVLDYSGQRIATIGYDDEGKAIRSELADGAERVDVSYPDDGQAIVKHYRDTALNAYREERYTFAQFRGQYRLTSKTITQCDQCELTTETWSFNARGLLERHTSPGGIVTEYAYDDQDRKIKQTVAVGTPEATTTFYTWNDEHNQLATVTTASTVTTNTYDDRGNVIQTLITPVQ